jgi:NAD(P)-dependent dehydrogenase (short-subunit alcohol dehydrogenase family)
MAEFEGQVALVTGAASGIGRSTALLYALQGAKVIVSDVTKAGGQETVQLIHDAGGEAMFIGADVSNPVDCEALIRQTIDAYGRLDVAFNNAGIGGDSALTADYGIEAWQKVININLSGVFYCMKYEIQAMLQGGHGAIVNMSSILGQVGFPTAAAYVAAKHGVVGLTQTAAAEYAAAGIRINVVGPAFIHTPLISGLEEDEASRTMLIGLHPIGRLGMPEEVAELVVWLSSDKASFMVGAYVPVDGGYLTR